MVNLTDIPTRLRQAGRTQADLARHLRLDPSSLTKTIRGERRLKADEMVAIEDFFLGGVSEPAVAYAGPRAVRHRGTGRRVPLYGYAAAGGEDRVAVNEGRVIDWIEAPPFWTGAGDLIGVRVIGESMEPRLFQGELVIAQLNLAPEREQDCIVEMHDGSALVKTYGGQRDGLVVCRQWNPAKEVHVRDAKVKALHAIIWRR